MFRFLKVLLNLLIGSCDQSKNFINSKALLFIEELDMGVNEMAEVVTLEQFGVRPVQRQVNALEAKVWEYLELRRQMEEIRARMEELRNGLISEVGVGTKVVGRYAVTVKEVNQTRLRTRDVRRYLEQVGILNRFVYEVKVKRVEVNELI